MKKIVLGILIVLCMTLTISSALILTSAQETAGYTLYGKTQTITENGNVTLYSATGNFAAVKADASYGINGVTIPFTLNGTVAENETFDIAMSVKPELYTSSVSFGIRFKKTGGKFRAQAFYSNGSQMTIGEKYAEVELPSGSQHVLRFKVRNEFNPESLSGVWEILLDDQTLSIDAHLIENAQLSFTDGCGYVCAVYNGTGDVSLQLGQVTSTPDEMKDLNNFGSAKEQWMVSFAAGLNTPVLAGYGKDGYFTIRPNYQSGQYTAYKADRTYALDGLEIIFDYYRPQGAETDYRIMYSDGSVFQFGFFIRNGSAADKANIVYYGGMKEVGTLKDVPFNFNGTNSIKIGVNPETGKWGADINGNRYLEDCSDILQNDVETRFSNQQANIYLWDADSCMDNSISIRAINGGVFSGTPTGWKKADSETRFEISQTGNVRVTSDNGAFKATKTDIVCDVTKFTHDFGIYKTGEMKQGVNIVLSSSEEWYENGYTAVVLTYRYAKNIDIYKIFNVEVGVYSNNQYTLLGTAQTSKFYLNAINHMAFGKTLNGWVLRLNEEELSFDKDISAGIEAVLKGFDSNRAYLQIQSKDEAGTSYEYKSAFNVLAQLSYPTNWAPGLAGGSDFGEPTYEGEQILIPPQNTLGYSAIKIDRRSPVDGFSITFDLMRTGGDDGKIFSVIVANSTSWYQKCKAIMFMFRPKGIESGEYGKATFSLAYSDAEQNLDLEGDQSKGGQTVEVDFSWQGENTISLNNVDDRWIITINGKEISSEVSATSKIDSIIDGFVDNKGVLQLWNGEAFTVFTLKELTEITPPKTQPVIIGSFNFDQCKVGQKLTIDLTQLFLEKDGDPLSYSVDKGTIDGTVWTYTVDTEGLQFVKITAVNQSHPELKAEYLVRINTGSDAAQEGGCNAAMNVTFGMIGMLAVGVAAVGVVLIRKKMGN